MIVLLILKKDSGTRQLNYLYNKTHCFAKAFIITYHE